MKLLLDTSYFLSYFKIEIKELDFDFLKQLLMDKELEIMISDISYSELVAKYFKLNLTDQNGIIEDVMIGLDAIKYESKIEKIHWVENPKIIELAFEFRKIHADFFDCIIFASAIVEADGIGTFDDTFFMKIKNEKKIVKMINEINPEFQFRFNNFKGIQKGLKKE